MAEIQTAPFATSSGHWYDRMGNMVETVLGAAGKPVAPDLRHARKLGLLPGVTGVLKVQDRPGLTRWLVDQALMSALTLPKIEGESLDAFKVRAREDSEKQAEKARDEGSSLHTALEMVVQGRLFDQRWKDHVKAVVEELRGYGVDLMAGDAEKSFAHPLGFGGKCDWHSHSQKVLLDHKSKPRIDSKKLAYDEHVQQLAALAEGLKMPAGSRLLNVFVGLQDCKVHVEEWKLEEVSRGWAMFQSCLKLWQLKSRYDSSFTQTQMEAA